MSELLLERLAVASGHGLLAMAYVWLATMLFKRLSPNLRAWLWRLCGIKMAIALVFVLSVPLLPSTEVVALVVHEPPPLADAMHAPSLLPPTPDRPVFKWTEILAAVWAGGVICLLAVQGWAVRRSRRQLRRAHPITLPEAQRVAQTVGLKRLPLVMETPDDVTPFVAGILRPVVVLPQSLSRCSQRRPVVLAHEFAHIRRRDILWQALLSSIGTIFWFLIPCHWATRQAKAEAEIACDAIAIQATDTNAGEYGRLLVELSGRKAPAGALAMGAKARRHLARRITHMNLKTRKLRLSTLLAVSLMLIPALTPWEATAQSSKPAAKTRQELDKVAMRHLFLPGVEDELGLTAEQRSRLDQLSVAANAEVRAFGDKLEDMKRQQVSDKDRIAYDRKIRRPMFERHLKERWDVLTSAQQARQRELTLQYLGPIAIAYPDVAKAVGLSPSTQSQIEAIQRGYHYFMTQQSGELREEGRKAFGFKTVQIRPFTAQEKKRMEQINKAIYTASGKRREALQKEYYEIRSRGIRNEGGIMNDPSRMEEFGASQAKRVDQLMKRRREAWANLCREALSKLTPAQKQRWANLQGKPFSFNLQEFEGKRVISYR